MKPQAYAKLKQALSANPGGLHRALHIPEGQKIPASVLAKAKRSKNPRVRKMAVLADTARHFKHK